MRIVAAERRRSGGYSLVEVSLAILVAGLALAAVFSLFPEGLKASRKAVEAGQVSAFADYVFASMAWRAAETDTTYWVGLGNSLPISHALAGAIDHSQKKIGVTADGRVDVYPWVPSWYGGGYVGAISGYTNALFTYSLKVVSNNVTAVTGKYARLIVWPGDRKKLIESSPSPENYPGGRIFYREYFPQQ